MSALRDTLGVRIGGLPTQDSEGPNFSAWLKREDGDGNNIFSGGFLGLDNISVVDRSHLPPGTSLEQSDATGWMAFYALTMAAIADRLGEPQPSFCGRQALRRRF